MKKITLDEAWEAYAEIMELVENRLHGVEGRATLYHYFSRATLYHYFKQQGKEQEQFENMNEYEKTTYLLEKLNIEVLSLGRTLDNQRNLFTYEIKGIRHRKSFIERAGEAVKKTYNDYLDKAVVFKSEPKFKVGDYVKVLPREGDKYKGFYLVNKIVTINTMFDDGTCWLNQDDGALFYWHEDWLEPASYVEYMFQNGDFELDYNLRHLALIPKRYISGVRTPKETHDYIADGIGYCLKHTLGDDYEKFALGRVTGFDTGHINIPSKIVFDEKLGRTTLLFGEKPYKSVVNAKAKTLSKFNFALGVKIALLKYFYNDSEVKEMFDLVYNNFKKDKIEPYFDKLLKERLHFLSEYQYNKLFSTKLLDGEIILDIKGYGRHTIEIERK